MRSYTYKHTLNCPRISKRAKQLQHTPLIPAFWMQKQADLWVQSQPGLQLRLHRETCLKKPKTNNRKDIMFCSHINHIKKKKSKLNIKISLSSSFPYSHRALPALCLCSVPLLAASVHSQDSWSTLCHCFSQFFVLDLPIYSIVQNQSRLALAPNLQVLTSSALSSYKSYRCITDLPNGVT